MSYSTEISKNIDAKIDELQAVCLRKGEIVDCPLKHVFTPGLYTRTAFMPKGALVTSLIHREEHQFFVLQGATLVKIGDVPWERITAPNSGVTKPGTRRVFFIESDCIWTTVHATSVYPASDKKEDVDAAVELVEDQIYVKRENAVLGGYVKNNVLIKNIDQCQE